MSSNVTSAFIDLATYDELERYIAGGLDAIAYFVREVRKSTWFSNVPVSLKLSSGSADFSQEFSFQISRAGDYLVHSWARVSVPAVTAAANRQLFWTPNFMHNLIRECSVTFNDLVAARFDNYHLDFWAAFTVPSGKQNGYENMIGNFAPFTSASAVTPAATLNLPLPFFFSRDSGVALPTAALPYNEMRITFQTRDWTELLLAIDTTAPVPAIPFSATLADVVSAPSLTQFHVWANYAIVSNEERTRMGQHPRDILIEQVQTAARQIFAPATNPQPSFDIRFSHAIKALFFGMRNTSVPALWSNYTTASPNISPGGVLVAGLTAFDPIATTSVIYENTRRLDQMGSDYYSLIVPYYQPGAVIPQVTGLHMYSYSLDFVSLDPMGSTNYGKLTNVSVIPEASPQAVINAAGGGSVVDGFVAAQTWRFILTGINNNIIRVSGGALGFPVL